MVTACSGIPTSQDFEQGFDFATLKTFAWEANEDDQWGIADNNELVDRRIRSAIENTLTARQFSQGIYTVSTKAENQILTEKFFIGLNN